MAASLVPRPNPRERLNSAPALLKTCDLPEELALDSTTGYRLRFPCKAVFNRKQTKYSRRNGAPLRAEEWPVIRCGFRSIPGVASPALLLACIAASPSAPAQASAALHISITANGQYCIAAPGATGCALEAGVAAEIEGHWLRSSDYPKHFVRQSESTGDLGPAAQWDVTFSGLAGAPDLTYRLRAWHDAPFADLQVTVHNTTAGTVHAEAIRAVEAASDIDLGGPAAQDRVLSDSFSEDRPAMQLHDLADATNGMHRGVGSQLIYNRQSHESLFVGALTSDRFLTILRLHLASGSAPRIAGFEVDSTGTTEMEKENSLQDSPADDRILLRIEVPASSSLSSERLLLSVGTDYHHQLETYGSLIRQIHHARVSAPPLMGWWSWTAFYFGLDEGAAHTNAQWEAEHLKQYGYNVVHIDEGYQYARGEYTTPNATLFPHGMIALEYKVRGLGLLPGIWTAPFEVSERSWVYQRHPEWLIHNAAGQPIPAGSVVDGKDRLFMLDTTHPGAQQYLRQTYTTLVHDWNIHYIKLDFMDDSAIEGYYYKPGTTAMEAQRIGLGIIRSAVGDHVFLDKDGSVMLNPVGYVDYGRISQDTGHTFDATKEAEPGIAARYYMDRNYFVSDPDAFAVSTQTISDQSWHESREPATLDQARASIALAAVTGGMFEIGDNLPSLQNSPERIALLTNQDLLHMVALSRASTPVDLMDYRPEDGQPTIFFLKESPRQSILTVFNWTKESAHRSLSLARLGLAPGGPIDAFDVFEGREVAAPADGQLELDVPAQSARIIGLVDRSVPAAAPVISMEPAASGASGETIALTATQTSGDPIVSWQWNFGDGVTADGQTGDHTWTEPGDYTATVTAHSLSGLEAKATCRVHIAGYMSTTFSPEKIRRLP